MKVNHLVGVLVCTAAAGCVAGVFAYVGAMALAVIIGLAVGIIHLIMAFCFVAAFVDEQHRKSQATQI